MRGNRVAMVYQDPMSSLNPVMTIGRQLIEVPMLHPRDERGALGGAPSPCSARCACPIPSR